MRTIIIGGSFDPVHIGHLFLAEEARCQLGYERVVFVPAFVPPHKNLSNEARPEQRLAMLHACVDSLDSFVVDDTEMLRGGVSYTVDTLPAIIRRYDLREKPGFVLGDDLVAGFTGWKEYRRLPELADLVIAHRFYRERVNFEFPHRYLENLILPVSSSDIRARVRAGSAFRHIVPEGVFRYIVENMLYRQRD